MEPPHDKGFTLLHATRAGPEQAATPCVHAPGGIDQCGGGPSLHSPGGPVGNEPVETRKYHSHRERVCGPDKHVLYSVRTRNSWARVSVSGREAGLGFATRLVTGPIAGICAFRNQKNADSGRPRVSPSSWIDASHVRVVLEPY